jgi:hypothetical protein
MKVIPTALTLLVVATTPFAVAGNKKGGGGGGSHGGFGGAKGGGHGGMAHQGNRGGFGGSGGKHGQHAGFQKGQAGGQAHQALGGKNRGFATRSTNGRLAFHNRGVGGASALHSRGLGATTTSRTFTGGRSYDVVVRNYHPEFHDHLWWVSHYNRVVIAADGAYYWDNGYWYPAIGYDATATPDQYAYQGPIYSYDNLPPDEVIARVQTELQFQGFMRGRTVDGKLGSETREAIANFQKKHGLTVTSAIDEPTANLLSLS